MVCPEDIVQVTVEAEASEKSCYTKPAGGSPVRVSADAPGSRPQAGIERSQAERGVKSLEKMEQNRGPQHEVKFAASSDFHPKGVRESRADHITAKATDMILESERVMDFSGVLNAGRGDGFVRNEMVLTSKTISLPHRIVWICLPCIQNECEISTAVKHQYYGD